MQTTAQRRTELRQLVLDVPPAPLSGVPHRLCEVAVDRLQAQGVGLALIASPQARGLLAGSGRFAGVVEDLQFSLGEGPCLDAFTEGVPALETDLPGEGRRRWPLFAESALEQGVAAVFAFPLHVGTAQFGVLDVARDRPAMLDVAQLADALLLAELASETVLRLQEGAAEDQIADELGGAGSERIVVHQATGMVAVQAGLDMSGALRLLREHASGRQRSLHDVARAVVDGQLVLPS